MFRQFVIVIALVAVGFVPSTVWAIDSTNTTVIAGASATTGAAKPVSNNSTAVADDSSSEDSSEAATGVPTPAKNSTKPAATAKKPVQKQPIRKPGPGAAAHKKPVAQKNPAAGVKKPVNNKKPVLNAKRPVRVVKPKLNATATAHLGAKKPQAAGGLDALSIISNNSNLTAPHHINGTKPARPVAKPGAAAAAAAAAAKRNNNKKPVAGLKKPAAKKPAVEATAAV